MRRLSELCHAVGYVVLGSVKCLSAFVADMVAADSVVVAAAASAAAEAV